MRPACNSSVPSIAGCKPRIFQEIIWPTDFEARLCALEVRTPKEDELVERITASDQLMHQATLKQEALGAAFAELQKEIRVVLRATPQKQTHIGPLLPLPVPIHAVDPKSLEVELEPPVTTDRKSTYRTVDLRSASSSNNFSSTSSGVVGPLSMSGIIDTDSLAASMVLVPNGNKFSIGNHPPGTSSGKFCPGRFSSGGQPSSIVSANSRTSSRTSRSQGQRPRHWLVAGLGCSENDSAPVLSIERQPHRPRSAAPMEVVDI